MTKILIGQSPMLSKRGVIHLHRLKCDETYFYMLSGKDDLVYQVSEAEFYEEEPFPEHVPYGEMDVISPTMINTPKATYFVSHFKFEEGTNLSTDLGFEWNEVLESIWFYPNWICLPDWTRTDEHVHQLYYENKSKYFDNMFDVENLRIIEIPDDVDWYIYQFEDGHEIIEEKSRRWG